MKWSLLILVLAAPFCFAHKFHASLAEVQFNAENGTLEIVLRLFADDLEDTLSKKHGRAIRLGRDHEALVHDYLNDRFQVAYAGSKPLTTVWVGMELDVDKVWAYLEMPLPEGVGDLKLKNRIFFELFDDQVNTVNILAEGKRETLIFTHGEDEFPLATQK